ERDLARLAAARAELLIRGVRGDTIEPAAERRLALERRDFPRGGPQRVLGRLLGVLVAPGDAQREPVHPVAKALDQVIGGVGLLTTQRFDEIRVDVHAGPW